MNEEKIPEWDVRDVNLCPPMISVSRLDLLPRGQLRGQLGIPSDSTVALISLGAGVINEIGEIRGYISDILTSQGIYVIIADSMLNPSKDSFDNPLVRVIREFPIMIYRNCFDFGIIAGGYNSVHESLFLKLPSIILPNTRTGTDDQLARALNAAEKGGFVVIEEEDIDLLDLALERISDHDVRMQMIESMADEKPVIDGSPYLAEELLNSV